ncbi:MAG: ATP-binding protein [Balneolales bacterium]
MNSSIYKDAFEKNPTGIAIQRLENSDDAGSLRQIMVNKAACITVQFDLEKENNRLWKDAYPELASSEICTIVAGVALTGQTAEFEIEYGDSRFPQACWKGLAWLISEKTVALRFTGDANTNPAKFSFDQKVALKEKKAIQNKNDLDTANEELLAFTYSVSHDLRAPLRRLDGFSQELLNSYSDKLDDTGRHYLNRIRKSAQNMGQLIDDLLKLSRISRQSTQRETVDLSDLSREIMQELQEAEPDRNVEFTTNGNLNAHADAGLARVVLFNLITNAWKFSVGQKTAQIEFGSTRIDGELVYYMKDNGTGFDMKYADKLFRAFQRLHSLKDFEGTGIGLATVKRIINIHGGKVWAESKSGKGSTFYFTFKSNI